jgi:hypothetical protein
MRFLLVILVAISCASCRHTPPAKPAARNEDPPSHGTDPNRWLCDSKFEGATYVFTVPDALLRRTSQWRADSDLLPLAPDKAEAAAISEARRLRPDVGVWGCDSLALRRADHTVWFYLVTLFRTDVPSAGLPDFLTVPVLLSGEAVRPVQQHVTDNK